MSEGVSTMPAAVVPHRHWYQSPRFWLSAATAAIVAVIVWSAWPTVVDAVGNLRRINLWILVLLVPLQLASFAATGEVLFSFLRSQGEISRVGPLTAMRMSLEFNFANHMLPAGGSAGIAYTAWKLNTLGVPVSRATFAQLVRFAVTFASFLLLLLVATGSLLLSGDPAPGVLWLAALIGGLAIGATVAGLVLLRRRRLLHRFAGFIACAADRGLRLIRRRSRIDTVALVRFFDGLHLELRHVLSRPRALIAPFAWSFAVNALDAGLFWVALAAFGTAADPALIFVAYGVATVASMVVVTPNGVGGYEVAMVGTLVAGGIDGTVAIAAVVLARVILLFGTIVFGWLFYQHSIATAGAPRVTAAGRR
ncbi:UPF0104 family protein [Rathayibacter rathayi]|uniref:UPF0104 family protein n=2 Tax=Rathayibacter rathayi TaxID=33887 RepID=A0ABX5A7N3_RATRA|nr:lysylphosphatidylglycerol synthase transmembrane domain-containing protein [Rathayibacter rathayi]AZZ47956.1 UPF0104 family protein [Rathayibacter rathayi]MWV74781.1 flippase-like domain-containing protein [Rathayibacter rathayi NCPPB 2980 = VKM Ac-1601]PPF51254.1 UPF0104 family protein [Rathayibacter rathayi]PPG35956.1 UPF0104 family protein [Rathayibacter rathayi]PPG71004.1 UPF0104 family protein [Rathayibacter rathayi]